MLAFLGGTVLGLAPIGSDPEPDCVATVGDWVGVDLAPIGRAVGVAFGAAPMGKVELVAVGALSAVLVNTE